MMAMSAAALAMWLDLTRDLEGVCPWLYLDVKGYVTIGIGNKVDPVGDLWTAGLDFRMGSRSATDEEVWEAWARVKSRQDWKKRGGKCFASLTAPRATAESIDRLVSRTASRMFASLAGYFPELPGWPDSAQVAIMLMAWALGEHFPATWPKFSAACRRLDFAAAAAESHMNEENQNPSFHRRNQLVHDRFIAAAAALEPVIVP